MHRIHQIILDYIISKITITITNEQNHIFYNTKICSVSPTHVFATHVNTTTERMMPLDFIFRWVGIPNNICLLGTQQIDIITACCTEVRIGKSSCREKLQLVHFRIVNEYYPLFFMEVLNGK